MDEPLLLWGHIPVLLQSPSYQRKLRSLNPRFQNNADDPRRYACKFLVRLGVKHRSYQTAQAAPMVDA